MITNSQKSKALLVEYTKDMISMIEKSLLKNTSDNFYIIATENPDLAVKYDKKKFLMLTLQNFVIIVTAVPSICVPGKYVKQAINDEIEITRLKAEEQFSFYFQNNILDKLKIKLSLNLEEVDLELVIKDSLVYYYMYENINELSNLPSAIQYGLQKKFNDYGWCVVATRDFICSDEFVERADVFYHIRFSDENKSFTHRSLRDLHIAIYKRTYKFESAIKNIISGKTYGIEIKHILVILALAAYVLFMFTCKSDYSEDELSNLGFFQKNLCTNQKSIVGAFALMFLIAIIVKTIMGKINKKKNQAVG